MSRAILGPTFEEMLHPATIDPATRARAVAALRDDPLDPVNLYNITWRGADNGIKYEVLPPRADRRGGPDRGAVWPRFSDRRAQSGRGLLGAGRKPAVWPGGY